MEIFAVWMDTLKEILWGPVMICLLGGTGLYLTFRLRFGQIRYFKHALMCVTGKYDDVKEEGDITHFQALCSALSATIGTGNIAGVATAIALGGPGAVFWMWVTAFVGMATKFSSCSLAIRYRVIHEDGSASGGPMYFLERGLDLKWLGKLFAFFTAIAAFGAGCTVQSNSVADGLMMVIPASWQTSSLFADVPIIKNLFTVRMAIGLVLSIMVGLVIIGGIRRIGQVASKIVPFMCVIYVGGALVILFQNMTAIPDAFGVIFRYAFTPLAPGAGLVGAVVARTLRNGVARGVFSNEAGLGSAPIAHAAAKTHEMAREGMVAMLGPFLDTIVICTMTALVIISTGTWTVRAPDGRLLYGPDGVGLPMRITVSGEGKQVIGSLGEEGRPYVDENGSYYDLPTSSSLTATAFEQSLPGVGKWIVVISLIFFAYSSMIAWSYYGDRSCEYLLGRRSVTPYRYIFCFFAMVGPLGGLDLVWVIADNLNALMALPNLIALLGLAGLVARETRNYVQRMRLSGDL